MLRGYEVDENDGPIVVEGDPMSILSHKNKLNLNPTDTEVTITQQNLTEHGGQDSSLLSDPNYWLHDMEYLYLRSFNELESVFRSKEFRESQAFKDMVLELNSNMIEYKFLHKAGILKAS